MKYELPRDQFEEVVEATVIKKGVLILKYNLSKTHGWQPAPSHLTSVALQLVAPNEQK